MAVDCACADGTVAALAPFEWRCVCAYCETQINNAGVFNRMGLRIQLRLFGVGTNVDVILTYSM